MRILKIWMVAFMMTLGFTGCLKTDNENPCTFDPCQYKAPDAEIQMVKDYLASKGITAQQHCSGVFYAIVSQGTGATPGICDYIMAQYRGSLADGTVFDEGQFQQPVQLGGLIPGWQSGLSLIKQGGQIHLYIPPSLGYGNQPYPRSGPVRIPANSILIFEVSLL